MEYIWLKEVDSTQEELKRILAKSMTKSAISNNANDGKASKKSALQIETTQVISPPQSISQCATKSKRPPKLKSKEICVIADMQTAGIGSRGNEWKNVKDSLMFSFAFLSPPKDLPKQSVALYLGFVFKEVLVSLGSAVWLKYPNDLYIKNRKIGGILVSIYQNHYLCGIGLNLQSEDFGSLDIATKKCEVLDKYFKILQKPPTWKQIFNKYRLEFYKNFSFSFHFKGECISLKDAILREDGALEVGGEMIYNLDR
ncbi:biotin--[acetyl-CoA-carboxylase] ligase [Helicobacter sp. T3_23-1056]